MPVYYLVILYTAAELNWAFPYRSVEVKHFSLKRGLGSVINSATLLCSHILHCHRHDLVWVCIPGLLLHDPDASPDGHTMQSLSVAQ